MAAGWGRMLLVVKKALLLVSPIWKGLDPERSLFGRPTCGRCPMTEVMSLASKVTFGLACIVSGATVYYVHYKQNLDRENLHEGVIKDVERQQRRKMENIYVLQQQADLTKLLRRERQQQPQQQDNNGQEEEAI